MNIQNVNTKLRQKTLGNYAAGKVKRAESKAPLLECAFNIPIMELQDSQCKFCVTEDSPFLFCGLPQKKNSSYCKTHHRICYTRRPS